MDIGPNAGYPASALRNFAPQPFYFDGVLCSSREGSLQAFKFDKVHMQVEVCKLVGLAAKRRGQKRNKVWKRVQKLWWNGVEYDRHGNEYQRLLDRLFAAALTNSAFQRALLASGKSVFTHAIGKSDPHETVLTIREFCSRLTLARARLMHTQRT